MSQDPAVALEEFLNAVRQHYAAAAHRASDTDPRVEAAYMALADAFEIYEDAREDADDDEDDGDDADDDDFDDQVDLGEDED